MQLWFVIFCSEIRSIVSWKWLLILVEGSEYSLRVSAVNKYGVSDPAETDKFIAKDPFGNSISLVFSQCISPATAHFLKDYSLGFRPNAILRSFLNINSKSCLHSEAISDIRFSPFIRLCNAFQKYRNLLKNWEWNLCQRTKPNWNGHPRRITVEVLCRDTLSKSKLETPAGGRKWTNSQPKSVRLMSMTCSRVKTTDLECVLKMLLGPENLPALNQLWPKTRSVRLELVQYTRGCEKKPLFLEWKNSADFDNGRTPPILKTGKSRQFWKLDKTGDFKKRQNRRFVKIEIASSFSLCKDKSVVLAFHNWPFFNQYANEMVLA